MHTHTIAGMAVSALKRGRPPLTQTATRFSSRLAYHDFNGPERDPAERDAPARDLSQMSYFDLAQSRPHDGGAVGGRSLHRNLRARALLPGTGRRHGLQMAGPLAQARPARSSYRD
jgi:ribulose-5-phosphate 4-epimerase/fuculose-1-phosphate aldolase